MERFISMMREFRKKSVIICHSEEEMNRKADALIEQGFQVERQSGVLPVQLFCIATYRVVFWK
jgi:triosephosphate isomerase